MTLAKSHALHLSRVAEYSARIILAERASRRKLTVNERARALGWYRIEANRLEGIAFEVREEGAELSARTAIAAAATLSPATSWHHLVADLPAFLESALHGDPLPPFATYGAQRRKAAAIVRRGLGVDAVTGPKVSAFARALSGDEQSVVVDRHAARIATGDDSLAGVTLAQLRAIQDAYRLAASRLGLRPAGLQALVWTARVGFGGEYGPPEGAGA